MTTKIFHCPKGHQITIEVERLRQNEFLYQVRCPECDRYYRVGGAA